MWNARGDQGYLSDGTQSGLDDSERKTQFKSITHEKRFVREPHCSQLECNPIPISYQIKKFEEGRRTDGIICRGLISNFSITFRKKL